MVEYTLDVGDSSDPESRLEFFNRFESFLKDLKSDGIIVDYTLSTPNRRSIIFKVKAEA